MTITYYKYIFIFAFSLLIFPVFGNDTIPTIVINSDFKQLALEGHVKLYATDTLMNINEFYAQLNSNEIDSLPADNFHPGMADKFYWVIVQFKNDTDEEHELDIEILNPLIDSIFFYEVVREDSIVFYGENGDEIPFYKRTVQTSTPVLHFHIQAGDSKKFILMLRKRKNIKFPIVVYEHHRFERLSRIKFILYILYFGGLLFISFSSLAVGILIRDKMLIAYFFYTISMWIFLFTELGYTFEFLLPHTSGLNSFIRVPEAMLTLISYFLFSNLFLKTSKNSKILSSLFKYYYILWIISYFLTIIIKFFNESLFHSTLIVIHYSFSTIGLILMVVSAIFALFHNKKTALVYIAAVSFFVIGIVIFYLTQFGLTKSEILNFHPFLFASISEITIFSFALLFNIKNTYSEKNKLIILTAKQEEEILKEHIRGAEMAKQRISSELHDDIASRLALIKNKILSENYAVAELSDNVADVYNDVRNISHRLSLNNFFTQSFSQTVKSYLHEVEKNTNSNLKITLLDNLGKDDLNDNIGIQIFRIIQEAVQNCIKYAQASNVTIQIILHEDSVNLTIEDDGIGFDTNNILSKNCNGIKNIKNRTELLNGTFEISSIINEGTYITVDFPLND